MQHDWATSKLGDLFEFKYGKGLPAEQRHSGGSVKVYGSNGIIGRHDNYLSKGPTIVVGRKGSVGEVNFSPYACWPIDTTYYIDAFPDGFPPKYWAFYLKSLRLGSHDKSSAIPGVSRKDIYCVDVAVPPPTEQRRIVARLEELLARVEACQKRLHKIPILLKRFRQSVLAAACSGRLTSDWRKKNPSGESAATILEAIHRRREAKAKTMAQREKVRAIFAISEENDSSKLPERWRFVTLTKISASFDYGTSAKSQPSGKAPVLRMGNIQSGKIDWTDMVYTSDDSEINKYFLQQNTVLFNRTNSPELVGKTALYRGEKPAIFAGYLIRVNQLPELDPAYLNLCLNTNYAKEFCLNVKTDGVSQSNINAQKLGAFEVPFCQLTEQQEIVRRVEDLLKIADQIEERYKKVKAYVDKLAQSILAKAFRGELVPQDTSEEPTTEMLVQIKPEGEETEDRRKRKQER